MLFSIEQSILAEETLMNLWSFAKSANVLTLQSFPPYGITIEDETRLRCSDGMWLPYHL